jgi:hypothetical protein
MAVAFDAKTAAGTSGNGVSPLNVTNMTVGSGANRALVLLVNCADSATGFPGGFAANWDSAGTPQLMTQITGTLVSSAGTGTTALYALLAPTSGAKTLSITWTTGSHEMHAQAVAFTSVDQTSIAVAFPHGTTNSGNADPATITVTTANGNAVVAVFAQSTGNWASTNNNTIDLDNTGPNVGLAGNYVLSTGASATMTATIGGAAAFDAAGTAILAAGGGAPVAPSSTPRLLMGMGV